MKEIPKGNVLALCEGMARNGTLLSKHFNKIDIIDIKPSFGESPEEKRGKLFNSNLANLGSFVEKEQYKFIFGNWALCYLGY